MRACQRLVRGWVAVCVAGLMAAPGLASVVPFYEDFEAPTWSDGDELSVNGWTSSSNVVQAQSSTVYAGSLTAEVPVTQKTTGYESTTNTYSDGETTVWIDFFTRPSLYTGDETARSVDGTASSLFFFSTNKYTVVRDGSPGSWVEKTTDDFGSGVSTINTNDGQWTRVTVYQNYGTGKWALFVDGVLLDDQIDMTANPGSLQRFVVQDNTYFDNLWMSGETYPDGIADDSNAKMTNDVDGDGLGDAYEIQYWGDRSTASASGDDDSDNLTNQQEFETGSKPDDDTSAIFPAPYLEMFENVDAGSVSASSYNTFSKAGGTVQVQSSQYISGPSWLTDTKAVELQDSSAAIFQVVDEDTTNVWVQTYVKPVPVSRTPVVDSESCGFCILTNGSLYVTDGSSWTVADRISTMPLNQWVGFAAHIDYENDQWDLYVSTSGTYKVTYKKANTSPLTLNSAAGYTYFSTLTITNASTNSPSYAYADAVAVSYGYSNCVATLTNLTAPVRLAGEDRLISAPPYAYATADTYLSAQIGDDLARSLSQNDVLRVYTNGSNWAEYSLDSGGLWQQVAGPLPNAMQIDKSANGLRLIRGSGRDVVAFYPYGAGDIPAPAELSATVTANQDSNTKGITPLAWPDSSDCVGINDGDNLGFDGDAVNGDELHFLDLSTYETMKYSWYNGDWYAMGDDVTATLEVCPGDGFFYLRKEDSSFTWYPNN